MKSIPSFLSGIASFTKHMSSYLAVLLLWALVYKGSELSGDWYYERYGVYQAIGSFISLASVYFLLNRKQRHWQGLMIILCFQVCIALIWQVGWDYPAFEQSIFYVSGGFYESLALKVLNPLEILLLIIGGIRMIHEYILHRHNTAAQPSFHG